MTMQELVLAGNKLKSIPDQIAKLTSLKRLQLAGNQLTALPNVITTMDHLQVIVMLSKLYMHKPFSAGSLT